MRLFILGVGLLIASSTVGVAQDMPLFTFTKLGAKWEKAGDWGEALPVVGIAGAKTAVSRDGATVFAGYPDKAAVWAYPVKDGQPVLEAGAPYAPLRTVAGYDNSREGQAKRKAATLAVTALLIDPAGRIYAATPKDVQVFDPTGRLCGTIPLPHSGGPVKMAWETTPTPRLVINIGGQGWSREMR